MAISFAVDKVRSRTQPLKGVPYIEYFASHPRWEASGCSAARLVKDRRYSGSPRSHFWSTIATAHNLHYPLTLSPDSVWITILQGFSQHVAQNPEKYRRQLGIKFRDKKTILIIDNNAVKDGETNWLSNIDKFTDAVKEDIGESRYNLFLNPFTTTKPIERAATAITMLSTFKSYYNLEMATLCGIPHVRLEGEREDWVDLVNRAQYLAEFDLEWWTSSLLKILEQFIAVFDNQIDLDFWSRIYNKDDMSGIGPCCSGWILSFFPYVNSHHANLIVPNPHLNLWHIDKSQGRHEIGLPTANFPDSIFSVPFTWDYLGIKYSMELVSGIVGSSQDLNLFLKPEVGFGVREIAPK